MANRVEDAPYGTPSAHPRNHDENIPELHDENVPELHDESIEEDSDEEEFAPEDVPDEPSQYSRFSTRGPADARAVSLSTARQIQASKDQSQNQPNSQPVSQKKTVVPPRQVDPKRYAK